MSQITVADVSRWQGRIDWDAFKYQVDAVIIKATGYDGGGYADSMMAFNRDSARRVGMPRWYYHYKGEGDATEQAAYCFGQIGSLQPGEAIVLDDENEAKVNPAFAAAFADKMKELAGFNVPIYSNLSRFQGVDLSELKSRDMGAWVAKYGANNGTIEGAGAPPSGLDMTIIGWQFTSTRRFSAIPENTVDTNLFYMTVDGFNKYGVAGSAVISAPSLPPNPPQPQGDGYYTVVKNDTLSTIAPKVGMAWQTLAATNGIVAPYTIFPGQRLRVFGGTPGQGQIGSAIAGGQYVVVSGDGLIAIGTKTGNDWKEIAALNNLHEPYTIYAGQRLDLPGGAVATPNERTYTVQQGDWGLIQIGEKTGADWKQIAQLNNIAAPYTIYPNQVLRLP